MKCSIYNSTLSIGDEYTLIYNALTDKYIIGKRNILPIEWSEHIENLDDRTRIKLINAGAIINDNINEVDTLKKIIDDTDNDDTAFQLHINPTVNCNFRCWYCYEKHVASMMDSKTIDNVFQFIDRTTSRPSIKTLYLSFFGGEPLLYFNQVVKPIIVHASTACNKNDIRLFLHFTTNGLLVNDAIVDFLKDFNTYFQITLDGGKEYHDRVRFSHGNIGSYDKILSNIMMLSNNKCNILVRVNYTKDNAPSISGILYDFSLYPKHLRENISFDFQRVWQDYDKNSTIEDTISSFVKEFQILGYRTSSHKIRHRVSSSCYGDKRNQALINYNGDVFLCTARDFKTDERAGYLTEDGTITWIDDALNKRMNCKFTRKECHNCRVAPLCGGGCRQKALENPGSECIYNYTNTQKDNIVLDRFQYQFLNT